MPYLVNIRLLLCETEMLLVFHVPQKVVAKERVDDDMLERRAGCLAGAELLSVGRIEKVAGKVRDDVCILVGYSVVGRVACFGFFL
jgi:hypothetical protein